MSHVGWETRFPASKIAQVAVCKDCHWQGSAVDNDALRVLQKMDHEDIYRHEVIWVDGPRRDEES